MLRHRQGVSPIIYILMQWATRESLRTEFGVGRFAGAMATKTINFLLAFLRKLRACRSSRAARANYGTDPIYLPLHGECRGWRNHLPVAQLGGPSGVLRRESPAGKATDLA